MAQQPLKGLALVTGASAGIGQALAREFARRGHDVVLAARSHDRLEALAQELATRHGVRAHVLPVDLAAPGAAERLYAEVVAQGLDVEILVNNAGLLVDGPFWETSLYSHEQLLQVNLVALTALTHLCLPGMVARRRGRVLNLASTSAFQPVPRLASYAASKAYVLSFSETLGVELASHGVTVTALCPGFTETDMISRQGEASMRVPMVKNLTAEEVARQGYEACMAGEAVHVNGLANRALVTLGQFQPRWVKRVAAGLVGRTGAW